MYRNIEKWYIVKWAYSDAISRWQAPLLCLRIVIGAIYVESLSTYKKFYRNIEQWFIIKWVYPDAISRWQAPLLRFDTSVRFVKRLYTYKRLYRNIEKLYIIKWAFPCAISRWQAPFWDLIQVQDVWKAFKLKTSFIETLKNDTLSNGPTLTRFRVDRPPFEKLYWCNICGKPFNS